MGGKSAERTRPWGIVHMKHAMKSGIYGEYLAMADGVPLDSSGSGSSTALVANASPFSFLANNRNTKEASGDTESRIVDIGSGKEKAMRNRSAEIMVARATT